MLRVLDVGRAARIKKSLDLEFVVSEIARMCPCSTDMMRYRLKRMNHALKAVNSMQMRWALERCPDITFIIHNPNSSSPHRIYMSREHYEKHYANPTE